MLTYAICEGIWWSMKYSKAAALIYPSTWSIQEIFFLRLLLWQLLKLLRIRFLNRSYPGTPPFRCSESRPYHEEPRLKTFLSYSSCTCSSVFAQFTNDHVDLVTGSESSIYWSWAVLWQKKMMMMNGSNDRYFYLRQSGIPTNIWSNCIHDHD